MNKWQIICPVVTLVSVALVFRALRLRSQGRVLTGAFMFAAVALLACCASAADLPRQPATNGAGPTPNQTNSLVSIQGRDVLKPGAYPWHTGMKMTELIKAADGLSDFGGGSHLVVTHTDGKKQTFKYYNIVSGIAKDPVLRSGDKVFVMTPGF